MSCTKIYDFINGTGIALPQPAADSRGRGEAWDILRPNEHAALLVTQHVRMLAELPQVKPETTPC